MKGIAVIGLVIVTALCLVAAMAGMAISSSGSSAAQAVAQIEASRLTGQIYAGEHAVNVMLIVLVIMLALAVLALSYLVIRLLLARLRANETSSGKWVRGPNARWGRVGQQPRLKQMDPLALMVMGQLIKDNPQLAGLLRERQYEDEEIDPDTFFGG